MRNPKKFINFYTITYSLLYQILINHKIFRISYLFIFISFLNCIVRLPPITFTQSGTAAERQMIGEEKMIEKDGWILSTIRTSALGSNVWKRERLDSEVGLKITDEEYLLHVKRIAFFAPEMKTYLQKGFLGEALNGKIVINPLHKLSRFSSEFPELKPRIDETIKLINESREYVYNKKISVLENEEKKPENLKILKTKVLLTYYNLASEGEYIEISKNTWVRKN